MATPRTCTICNAPIPDTAKVADVTMTSTNPYADAYDADLSLINIRRCRRPTLCR